jgi:putative ABC transport system ATP-binding protein
VTAVIGRSGSGKSTLLNLLAGLLTPTSGDVTLDGEALYGGPDLELSQLRNRKIGIIPQGQAALQSLTVRQNILLPLGLFPDAPAPDPSAELMELVGIPHLADARPATLSGGELRRMAIARAMIRRPEVILADEPTSDLDEENTSAVTALMRQAADQGAAVLLVTHELDTLQIADTVYRMDHGALKNSA